MPLAGRIEPIPSSAQPGADAYPKDAVPRLLQPELGGEREDVARSGGAERVPDRHRAAVRVQPLVRNLEAAELIRQLAQDRDRDRRVRLVHLPDIDVLG